MSLEKITPTFINDLLAQPSMSAQSAYLETAELLNLEGLTQLFDFANESVGNNPGQARQLAMLCTVLAEIADASAIVPQATYLRAQTHAINGEFLQAGDLIKSAREQYLSQGQVAAALRTNVGLIGVLAEVGQYQEAIDAGLSTLDTIEQDHPNDLTPINARMLSGLIHDNLGTCYKLIGNYDQALRSFSLAEALYQEAGMAEESATLAMSRGSILLNVGRGLEALTALQSAAAVFAGMDDKLLHAQCLNNLGNAHLFVGNYTQSLDTLREARRLLNTLDAEADQMILRGLMADAYMGLNLYTEAIAEYRAANEGLEKMGMAYQRGWVLWGLGAALTAQSQWEEAEVVLSQAATLFQEAHNNQLLSGVLLEQAALLAARNERGMAVQLAYQAYQLVDNEELPVQRVYALLRLADLVLPDTALAESLLLDAQQLISAIALPHLRYRLRQRLGHLYLLLGRDKEAEPLLEAAVMEIEQIRGNLTQETLRASFLRDKLAAYEDLAQLYLARGDEASLQKALHVTEQAKSRTLADLLIGLVETKLSTDTEPETFQRLQTLRAELNATYNQALRGGQEGERAVRWNELNERATSLENEINRLRLELAGSSDSSTAAQDLSFDTLRAQLPPDLTLLAYHILGDELLVFVYQNGNLRVKRHLADVTTMQKLVQELGLEWRRFQADDSFVSRHIEHLEQSAQQVLHELYDLLITPIATWLRASESVTPRLGIVPHGLLHQVPFQALFDGQRYLIDCFEMVYAPSATLLAYYQQPKPLRNNKTVVFGVSDPLIPHIIAEAHAVARHRPQAELYLDEQATLATFREQALSCGILHLACHGLFRGDNSMFSSLQLSDAWLTAADVMELDLTDTFVTLSACESGRSNELRGDEILGLTRAFLGAGARALIVSLWLIEDESSATLMSLLYEQLAEGADYSTALRAAQLTLKKELPHPYYWAPFIAVGQITALN